MRLEDRFGDSRVGATAAEISAHAFAHAFGIVAGLPSSISPIHHDLSGAEPALQAVVGNKGVLHGVKLVALRHTLIVKISAPS